MRVRAGQVTPMHYHWQKTEDIINRGGGNLVVELYLAHKEDSLRPEEDFREGKLDKNGNIIYLLDGAIRRLARPGEKITLKPGQSITLEPRMYHTFYGEEGRMPVMVGEVSGVNSDVGDNRFLHKLPRFPEIEEDQPARYVLCNEYAKLIPEDSK